MGEHSAKPINIQPRHGVLPRAAALWVRCLLTIPDGAPVSTASVRRLSRLEFSRRRIITICFKDPASQNARGPLRAPAEPRKFHIINPAAIWGPDVDAGNELWTSSPRARGPCGPQTTDWDQVGRALIDPGLVGLLFVNSRNSDALL